MMSAGMLPADLRPGNYGVSHGAGMVGELIRSATQSWAGHAFIYIGDGQIIEATAPATRIAPAASHGDAIWNVNEHMTDEEGQQIVARAHALVGTPYDYPAYVGFALEILHIRNGAQLSPYFKQDKWRVCSADVADAYAFAGIDLTANLHFPNLVSPANLLSRIVRQSQGKLTAPECEGADLAPIGTSAGGSALFEW